MARRQVDVSALKTLVQQAQGQEIVKGFSKTTDKKFPVFPTPINQNKLVYIPQTNVVVTENGSVMNVLNSHIHDYNIGKGYGQIRCISGLQHDELGYDGTCPFCEGTGDCWKLYNVKLKAEASKVGIDPQNDPQNVLKSIKDRLLSERAIKDCSDYVTFPIVVIPTVENKMIPTADAMEHMEVFFVTWRKQRYEESLLSVLDNSITGMEHIGGTFFQWKYTYATEGKQANARDSAKNAKYLPIQDAQSLQTLQQFVNKAEELAKDFTLEKATEVIVANQFWYKEDMEAEVDKILASTRAILSQLDVGELGNTTSVPAIESNNALDALKGFSLPTNLGGEEPQPQAQVQAPVQQVAPQGGFNPVKIG